MLRVRNTCQDPVSVKKFEFLGPFSKATELELVSKELNHLADILHVYAGGLNFMK